LGLEAAQRANKWRMLKEAGKCDSSGIENMLQKMWNLCRPALYEVELAREVLDAASASSRKTGLSMVDEGGSVYSNL
jgi:hypothetical protein